jgi:hypothetical protein
MFWATFFHIKNYALILTKTCIGQHFGRIFQQLIWSPCSKAILGMFVFDSDNGQVGYKEASIEDLRIF